jgi:hypothetical protein
MAGYYWLGDWERDAMISLLSLNHHFYSARVEVVVASHNF